MRTEVLGATCDREPDVVACAEPGCGVTERLPDHLVDRSDHWIQRWLRGRAWTTDPVGRHLCPEHW